MYTHRIRLPFGEHRLKLLSDLHIGSNETDYKLIKEELQEARDLNARVLVDGDIFDLILPRDEKKYRPDAMHPRLRGRCDIKNEALRWGVELFSPVADLLDLLGTGNHDDWSLKGDSFDMVSMLADGLGRPETYGGYTGFMDYRFSDDARHAKRFVMWYHHGSGKGATLSGSAGEFTKKMAFIDADLIWLGHKHFQIASKMRKISCPLVGEGPKYTDVRYVMTGSYLDTWTADNGKSRQASYAEDAALPPQGKGGATVKLIVDRDDVKIKIET